MSVDSASMAPFLLSYPSALRHRAAEKKDSKTGADLLRIDAWISGDFDDRLRRRRPPFLDAAELAELTRWKLARGKFRPRLQKLVESNAEAVVRESSKKAFERVDADDLSSGLKEMCLLKGVGPATASLVLSRYAPEKVPFMSDEAVTAVLGVAKIDYTLTAYLRFAEKVADIVRRWNKEQKEVDWTPSKVETAFWSRAMLGSGSSGEASGGTGRGMGTKRPSVDGNVEANKETESGKKKKKK